jgi:2-polyprenyl-3-methyl-5-hydroxy-6-metoxy-1,4-benzoquinol methylase
MIKRIQAILQRERQKEPDTSAVSLLFKRVLHVMKHRVNGYYTRLSKDSTFNSEEEMFMCSLFPEKVLSIVLDHFRPSSVLDVGCGTGRSLEYFLEQKINAIGIENSATAISLSPVKNHILKYNLNKEVHLNRMFDLIWCFEVIEHIHPDYERNFLNTLINHSNVIILSAARPGQGGHGHFNEQEPEYWISKFSKYGYQYDADFSERIRSTMETHAENLLCFKK